jgi:hypothetical protein
MDFFHDRPAFDAFRDKDKSLRGKYKKLSTLMEV